MARPTLIALLSLGLVFFIPASLSAKERLGHAREKVGTKAGVGEHKVSSEGLKTGAGKHHRSSEFGEKAKAQREEKAAGWKEKHEGAREALKEKHEAAKGGTTDADRQALKEKRDAAREALKEKHEAAKGGTTDADRQALKEKRDAVKGEKTDAERQAIKEKRDAAKGEKTDADRQAIKEKRDAAKAEKSEHAGQRVDKRQDNQSRRIEHGVKKGYLTPEEVTKLESQQKTIADMEASYKSDGKLTRDEAKSLKSALDDASRTIWAEKHDTEGNQMPVYRLGKNVYAKTDWVNKLENGEITGADAKAMTKDFRQAMTLKKRLSSENLSEEQRAKLQAEYNELLNKYFETR